MGEPEREGRVWLRRERAVLMMAGEPALPIPVVAADHFSVLGVPRRWQQDAVELERVYKDRARQVHPDRFVRADALARRAALTLAVAVNDAWRTLKDPVRRAEYLLGLWGTPPVEKTPVPQSLLMDVLERREALMEARQADDEGRVAALVGEVRVSRQRELQNLEAGFAMDPPPVESLIQALAAVRYWDRFLDEADDDDVG